jgi:carbon monoxide dehydrogenase subunit G
MLDPAGDGNDAKGISKVAFQGEYSIFAPREQVWAALNDPEVLKACIPGCEELTKTSDTQIEAKITAQLGPIRSKFSTQIVLSDLNPPEGYTLSGEGKGVAGFGRGSAKVTLSEADGGTLLRYDARLGVGGKLAQVGSRLVESATRSYADQFFERFAKYLNGGEAESQPAEVAAEAGADEAAPEGASSDGKSGKSRWWKLR